MAVRHAPHALQAVCLEAGARSLLRRCADAPSGLCSSPSCCRAWSDNASASHLPCFAAPQSCPAPRCSRVYACLPGLMCICLTLLPAVMPGTKVQEHGGSDKAMVSCRQGRCRFRASFIFVHSSFSTWPAVFAIRMLPGPPAVAAASAACCLPTCACCLPTFARQPPFPAGVELRRLCGRVAEDGAVLHTLC